MQGSVAIMVSGRRALEIGSGADSTSEMQVLGFAGGSGIPSFVNGLMLDCRMVYRLQREFERQSGR